VSVVLGDSFVPPPCAFRHTLRSHDQGTLSSSARLTLAGAEDGDAGKGVAAVTALGRRLSLARAREQQLTVSFLMWWTTSLPPGVFTTRLRLEVVL
jgi:hypothetical protein